MNPVRSGLPAHGEKVLTACGGVVEYAADTPRVRYQDRWLYFCLPDCRIRFKLNPAASCLAENLSGEDQQRNS